MSNITNACACGAQKTRYAKICRACWNVRPTKDQQRATAAADLAAYFTELFPAA